MKPQAIGFRFLTLSSSILTTIVVASCGGRDSQETIPEERTELLSCDPSLREYLVVALSFQESWERASADFATSLTGFPPDAPTSVLRDGFTAAIRDLEESMARIRDGVGAELAAASPPAEAKDYHDSLLDINDYLMDVHEDLARGIEEDDDSRQGKALDSLGPINEKFAAQTNERFRLATCALRGDGEDSLDTYLIAVEELDANSAETLSPNQDEFGELLVAGDIDGARSWLEDLIAETEADEARVAALVPPPEAEGFHERRADAMAELTSAMKELADTLDEGSQVAEQSLATSIAPAAVRTGELSADWTALLKQALSR
jgi:hypothetical protein